MATFICMVDTSSYRCRQRSLFCSRKCSEKSAHFVHCNVPSLTCRDCSYFILYVYYILYITVLMMYMLIDMEYTPFSSLGYEMYNFDYINSNNTFHTRTMVMILIAKLIILCVANKKQRILLVSFFTYHNRKFPKTNTSRFCKLKMMLNTSFSLLLTLYIVVCPL